MKTRLIRVAAVLSVVSCVTLASVAAAADTADRELAAAERAYREVDFPATYEHATAGLAAGGSRPERVARLAVLAGMSAAALGRDDEARVGFILALALTPALKLDKSLSPKIRGPYLEAQGYWTAHADRLQIEATTREGTDVAVRLADPARLVSKIALSARGRGESRYRPTPPVPAADSVRLALPADVRGRDFDYLVRALDAQGNILAEAGFEEAPLTYDRPLSADVTPTATVARRSYVLPVTFAALGVGAAALGAVFHVQREDAAREWNGPGCEAPGPETRLEQCGELDEDIRRDGRIAVISYAAAGVLLTTSVVTWFLGAPRPVDARSDFAKLPACGVAGLGLSCAGRF